MSRAIVLYAATFALAAALFSLFPGIDLWTSGLFYRPEEGFFLANAWPLRLAYAAIPYIVDAIVIGVPVLFLISVLRRRPVWGIERKAAAFLLLSLALGPGLVVNAGLKDHWGRARPVQVTEFGGSHAFTPALLPAKECQHNCSFTAGHPAVGFYLVSLAFLIPGRRTRRAATAAALGFGALIGLVRMAQGGHFLSDVVFSALLVYGTSWLAYAAIMQRDGLGALLRLAQNHPERTRQLAWRTLDIAIAIVLAIIFVDRPVALFFHDGDPTLHDVFAFITRFGLSTGYLIISGVLFIGLRIGARYARDAARAAQFARHAGRALFVFLAVAVSGLLADLLKGVFGRARPKLLFQDGVYGFTWDGRQADYWSFPSGHATTIVALATALNFLWPRAWPAYLAAALLVSASRVIIGAHYLSDVIGGSALGLAVTWALWTAMAGPQRYPLKSRSR